MEGEDKVGKFALALSRVQEKMPTVKKNKSVKYGTKTGGATQYNYADLTSMTEAVRQAMKGEGLAITFTHSLNHHAEGGKMDVMVVLRLYHMGGYVQDYYLSLPVQEKASMGVTKAIGAIITYAMRYLLRAVFFISSDDDILESIDQATEQRQQYRQQQTPRNYPPPSRDRVSHNAPQQPPKPREFAPSPEYAAGMSKGAGHNNNYRG